MEASPWGAASSSYRAWAWERLSPGDTLGEGGLSWSETSLGTLLPSPCLPKVGSITPALVRGSRKESSSEKAKVKLWFCPILAGGANMPQSCVQSILGSHFIPIHILHADPKLWFLMPLLLLTENSPEWQLYKKDVVEDKIWLTTSLQMRGCQEECILICGFAEKNA